MPLDVTHAAALELLGALGVTEHNVQRQGGCFHPGMIAPSSRPALPEGAAEHLVPTHPDLERLRIAYRAHPAAAHVQWTPAFVGDAVDLRYFRADNGYLWQTRALGIDLRYLLTAYYVKAHDRLGLCARLEEDGLFGAHTVLVDGDWLVSRDLLDSILEIHLVSSVVSSEATDGLRILDIGAGYGRLAHRLSDALPNLDEVICADAVPESTFLCDYYLRFRGARARSVPLDAVQAAVEERPVDLAVSIHAFSECGARAIAWWLTLLRRCRVPRILIGANERDGAAGATFIGYHGEACEMAPLFRAFGYERTRVVAKYRGSSAQRHCLYPTHYHLFEPATA